MFKDQVLIVPVLKVLYKLSSRLLVATISTSLVAHDKLYITDPLWDKKGFSTIEQSSYWSPWLHKTI